jgi:hypothetical protein
VNLAGADRSEADAVGISGSQNCHRNSTVSPHELLCKVDPAEMVATLNPEAAPRKAWITTAAVPAMQEPGRAATAISANGIKI